MRTVLVGATLIDGTGADPRESCPVTVQDGSIAALGEPPHAGDEIVDVNGLTLLPGLINAHTHLGVVALLQEDEMPSGVVAAWTFEHLRRCLDLGITTVRDVAGLDGGVASAVEAGIARGPRVIPAGPAIVQTGGHGEFRPRFVADPCVHHAGVPGLSILSHPVDSPDQMRHAARLAFKRGARFLKLCISGGVTSTTDDMRDIQFTVEEMRVAVEEARARRTYVTAHTHSNEALRRGLEAGIECFEHASFLDEETAAAVASAGAAIVPTLSVVRLYDGNAHFLPSEIIARAAGVEEGMRVAIRMGHAHGILVGCGSDLIGPDQRRYGLEVSLVAEVVGAALAIQTATLANARVLRIADRVGSVELGKVADLVAVAGDPLADPALLDDPARIVVVMKGGRIEKDIRHTSPTHTRQTFDAVPALR